MKKEKYIAIFKKWAGEHYIGQYTEVVDNYKEVKRILEQEKDDRYYHGDFKLIAVYKISEEIYKKEEQ